MIETLSDDSGGKKETPDELAVSTLQELFRTVYEEGNEVTPQVARALLEEYNAHVPFSLHDCIELLSNFSRTRVVEFNELFLWVKIVYLIHVYNSTQEANDLKSFANNLFSDHDKLDIGKTVELIKQCNKNPNINVLDFLIRAKAVTVEFEYEENSKKSLKVEFEERKYPGDESFALSYTNSEASGKDLEFEEFKDPMSGSTRSPREMEENWKKRLRFQERPHRELTDGRTQTKRTQIQIEKTGKVTVKSPVGMRTDGYVQTKRPALRLSRQKDIHIESAEPALHCFSVEKQASVHIKVEKPDSSLEKQSSVCVKLYEAEIEPVSGTARVILSPFRHFINAIDNWFNSCLCLNYPISLPSISGLSDFLTDLIKHYAMFMASVEAEGFAKEKYGEIVELLNNSLKTCGLLAKKSPVETVLNILDSLIAEILGEAQKYQLYVKYDPNSARALEIEVELLNKTMHKLKENGESLIFLYKVYEILYSLHSNLAMQKQNQRPDSSTSVLIEKGLSLYLKFLRNFKSPPAPPKQRGPSDPHEILSHSINELRKLTHASPKHIGFLSTLLHELHLLELPSASEDPAHGTFILPVDLAQSLTFHIKIFKYIKKQRNSHGFSADEIEKLILLLVKELMEITPEKLYVSIPLIEYQLPPNDFEEKLHSALKEFKTIKKKLEHNNSPTEQCARVIHILKSFFRTRTIQREPKSPRKSENPYKLGLYDIFEFYSKQPSLADPHTEVRAKPFIRIGKFMSFCLDFHLIFQKNDPRTKILPTSSVSGIFYRNSDSNGRMLKDNFVLAIDSISDCFFNNEYDSLYNLETSSVSLNEKIILMYEYLECYDPLKYGKKMKGYGNPYYVGNNRRKDHEELRKLKSVSPRLRKISPY